MKEEEIKEICRRSKVSDYLTKKGITLLKSGNKLKCVCPLPDHKDSDPSFYILTKDDGTEFFKCYGCGKWGDIITIVQIIEGDSFGRVARRLAKEFGISLSSSNSDSSEIRVERAQETVLDLLCSEDRWNRLFSDAGREFLEACMESKQGVDDAVDKLSLVYEKLDSMVEEGNADGIRTALAQVKRHIYSLRVGSDDVFADRKEK